MNSLTILLDLAARNYGSCSAYCEGDRQINYLDLRSLARSIASALLQSTAVRSKTPIVVFLPKGIDCVAGFLAALYSGNPYVPVDYKTPIARLQAIMEVLGDCLIVSDSSGVQRLNEAGIEAFDIADMQDANKINNAGIDARAANTMDADPAYIMFTSGSTGVPKGVAIPHRAVIDYANWVVDTFNYDQNSIFGNQAAFYFANSIFDIYGAMRCGAKVDLIPEVLFTFPSKLPAYLAEKNITSIFWVPTVMKNVANSGVLDQIALPNLETIAFCGEILSAAYLNVWRAALPEAQYANLYGMTEAADACCYFFIERDFDDSEALPIGRPCRNMYVTVLDDHGLEAGVDEVGEIAVLGAGLALGYWNRSDLTEKAFVSSPFESRYHETLYLSGDLGYRGKDGLLYVKGRKDSQVKVKGNRIELGEVECAAATLSGAQNVCVFFDAEQEEIVLFVQTSEKLRLRPVNQELKKLIPDYMLPSRLEIFEQFPLTLSGKIDRMKLRKDYGLV
ncbi:MAG: amino acid adenylation domain-containing protein [Coriobacteriia bacterium]|nr:amino acid adenylation domain-containing protein [Coriobacteriia bacterium]